MLIDVPAAIFLLICLVSFASANLHNILAVHSRIGSARAKAEIKRLWPHLYPHPPTLSAKAYAKVESPIRISYRHSCGRNDNLLPSRASMPVPCIHWLHSYAFHSTCAVGAFNDVLLADCRLGSHGNRILPLQLERSRTRRICCLMDHDRNHC